MHLHVVEEIGGIRYSFPPECTVCLTVSTQHRLSGLDYFKHSPEASSYSSMKTFTLTPRGITMSYAGAMHYEAWFIFTQCIFNKVFVLFFPLRRGSGAGIL